MNKNKCVCESCAGLSEDGKETRTKQQHPSAKAKVSSHNNWPWRRKFFRSTPSQSLTSSAFCLCLPFSSRDLYSQRWFTLLKAELSPKDSTSIQFMTASTVYCSLHLLLCEETFAVVHDYKSHLERWKRDGTKEDVNRKRCYFTARSGPPSSPWESRGTQQSNWMSYCCFSRKDFITQQEGEHELSNQPHSSEWLKRMAAAFEARARDCQLWGVNNMSPRISQSLSNMFKIIPWQRCMPLLWRRSLRPCLHV